WCLPERAPRGDAQSASTARYSAAHCRGTRPLRSDPWLGSGRTWNDILYACLQRTVVELRQQLGDNPHQWHYGHINQLTLRHAMGRVPTLRPLFNRGPWRLGGDLDTLCMSYSPRDVANQPRYHAAPLFRMICNPADWDTSRAAMLGGQSGHPSSKHYADLAALWMQGTTYPLLWSRQQVEQHTTARLVLER
ncbi:MAG: penicillin acylase family protein, partial [Chloroflexaceae bacterium]|nr:penicillin acylase family protein [Chloroflexaceae bacterium]